MANDKFRYRAAWVIPFGAANEPEFAFAEPWGTALDHRTDSSRPRQIGAAGKPPVSDMATAPLRSLIYELLEGT